MKLLVTKLPRLEILLSVSLFFTCSFSLADNTKLDKRTIKVGKYERSYYIRYPIDYESQYRFPLLISLHGGGRGNGDENAEYTGFAELADKENFIAVFPNGLKGKWHDGRLPNRKQEEYIEQQNNDIAFIKALIDYLIQYEQVDAKRVYVTGLSNGGMMSMRMACEASEKITAIAPVIANMPVDIIETCKPKSKISFLLMNGTEDPLIPWQGGEIKAVFKERGKVVSTEATVDFWLKHNACGELKENITLANKNTKDGSMIGKQFYSCAENTEVIFYIVRGGGHTLPGSNIPNRPRLLGKKNLDANGAELIWNFFKTQSK